MADIEILVKKLINTKRIADGKIATFSCQGQAMDGYSELAEYRSLINQLETAGGDRIPPRLEGGD